MKEKLKNIKGITLIALVITIIVMIILVAVSVTVALQGGLFTTAKITSNKTELEKDKELLMAAAVGALGEDGKVVYANIQLPEGFEKESDGTYKKDGYIFKVDEYGTVILDNSIDFDAIKAAVIANPETYLAKAEEAGQNTTSNTDIGIGTDGEIVNLDLWTYETYNDGIRLVYRGSTMGGYKGQIINGKIEGTMPQHILIGNEFKDVIALHVTFAGLTNLVEAPEIPKTVTDIQSRVFYNCTNLERVTIPNSVTSIFADSYTDSASSSAFYNCTKLEEIIIDNTEGSIEGSPWYTNATVTWLR